MAPRGAHIMLACMLCKFRRFVTVRARVRARSCPFVTVRARSLISDTRLKLVKLKVVRALAGLNN